MKSEQDKLFQKICRKAGATLRDEGLLEPCDHILLGLSGGKDSMIMLEVMAERKSRLPFDVTLSAAHVHVEGIGYEANTRAMAELCEKLGIDFIVRRENMEQAPGKEKGRCFICSWQRRKSIFDLSLELGCNKVAFGHHRYDALETLLINMIYHGSISSMPYELSMFAGKIKLIRPLLNMNENLLNEYAELRHFNSEGIRCVNEESNRRKEMRELIMSIDKLHSKGSLNMYRSMNKIHKEYLPQQKK